MTGRWPALASWSSRRAQPDSVRFESTTVVDYPGLLFLLFPMEAMMGDAGSASAFSAVVPAAPALASSTPAPAPAPGASGMEENGGMAGGVADAEVAAMTNAELGPAVAGGGSDDNMELDESAAAKPAPAKKAAASAKAKKPQMWVFEHPA